MERFSVRLQHLKSKNKNVNNENTILHSFFRYHIDRDEL